MPELILVHKGSAQTIHRSYGLKSGEGGSVYTDNKEGLESLKRSVEAIHDLTMSVGGPPRGVRGRFSTLQDWARETQEALQGTMRELNTPRPGDFIVLDGKEFILSHRPSGPSYGAKRFVGKIVSS